MDVTLALQRAARERRARQMAESLLESRSRELWEANQALAASRDELEERVRLRTAELSKRNDELANAKRTAESVSAAKSTFLAHMSHELRTPLAAVLGFADLLHDEDLSQDQVLASVAAIERNGRHLLELLDGLLDLARIEAGREHPVPVVSSLTSIASAAMSGVASLRSDTSVPVVVTMDEHRLLRIELDERRVVQVFINLIANALKFTEHGQIDVRVELAESPEPRLIGGVSDTGVGMDEQQLERLVRPFEQGDGRPNRRHGGSGLGLAIVQAIIRVLGGTLTIQSELGVGSEFKFSIPIRTTPPKALTGAKRRRSMTSPQACLGLHVLIVDDTEDLRALVERWLVRAGATVEMATDGSEAVHSVLERGAVFDVILMDMQMPRMDGFAATRKLRAAGVVTPILALTAHARHVEEQRCLDAGCSGYLAKPTSRRSLLGAVVALAPD